MSLDKNTISNAQDLMILSLDLKTRKPGIKRTGSVGSKGGSCNILLNLTSQLKLI